VEGGENGGNRVAAVGKYIVDFVREKKNGEPRWGSSDVLGKVKNVFCFDCDAEVK